MKKLLWYGWPVLFLIVTQAWIVLHLPAKPLYGGELLRLGLFAGLDLIVAGLQWWSYRQTVKFHQMIARLYKGRCSCELRRADFPCDIHGKERV